MQWNKDKAWGDKSNYSSQESNQGSHNNGAEKNWYASSGYDKSGRSNNANERFNKDWSDKSNQDEWNKQGELRD